MNSLDKIIEYPLSFRTVEANNYRAALLLFYEQNNLSAFKKMFLEQVEYF